MSVQFCEFCEILTKRKSKPSQIIAQDDQFFAFHDIDDSTANAHILVCTKKHIQSALEIRQLLQLQRMKQFATVLLNKVYIQKNKKNACINDFRFGFHVPPFISVFHIHLHCFILPFRNKLYDSYKYAFGPNFKSIQEITSVLSSKL